MSQGMHASPVSPTPHGGQPPAGDDFADEQELSQFLPLAYEELRTLAANLLRRRPRAEAMRATSLVHEAWLRLAPHGEMSVRGRGHFLAIAARAMRHVLVDNARRAHAQKRGGDRERVGLLDEPAGAPERDPDLLAVDEALTRLAQLDPRKARVVELRFFGGLELQETAEVLAVSVATVKRDWVLAKAWLHREIHEGGAGVARPRGP
jgi:RNA polymerase sigma factor (TIGR02999 family)